MWTKTIANKEHRKFGFIPGLILGGGGGFGLGILFMRGCAAGAVLADEEKDDSSQNVIENQTAEQTPIPPAGKILDEDFNVETEIQETAQPGNLPENNAVEQPKPLPPQPKIETLAGVQADFLKRAEDQRYLRRLGVLAEYNPELVDMAEKYMSIIRNLAGYYIQEDLSSDQEKIRKIKELDTEIRVFLNLPAQGW
jgi:hypothetical protein